MEAVRNRLLTTFIVLHMVTDIKLLFIIHKAAVVVLATLVSLKLTAS